MRFLEDVELDMHQRGNSPVPLATRHVILGFRLQLDWRTRENSSENMPLGRYNVCLLWKHKGGCQFILSDVAES